MKSDIDFVTVNEIAYRARDTGGGSRTGYTQRRLNISIQTTGEAHDPDDRKGGSRVRSVRLF